MPFSKFAEEMSARHVTWVIERELAGDPFAARFLQPAKLTEAARFYLTKIDVAFLFNDNGYMQTIRSRGDGPTYQQIALWLRRIAVMTFFSNLQLQQISEQLFLDAADAADAFAPESCFTSAQGRRRIPRVRRLSLAWVIAEAQANPNPVGPAASATAAGPAADAVPHRKRRRR